MNDYTIIFMIGGSTLLGVMSLVAFLWALKNNQFDDDKGSMNSVFFDSEDDLNDLAKRLDKKKKYNDKREDRK